MDIRDWLGHDNQLGIDIVDNKYLYNNETFNELLDRISNNDEAVRKEIEAKRFLFGGRIIANRGLYKYGVKTTYSNCYVLPPPEDNIESIYDTAGKLARTFSYGGGVGIDISKLAPRGAKVNNTAKETSGAVSFMDLFSLTTGLIGQNGRRGALMLSIDCNHPDLEEFIEIKSDLDKITKANISIRITDDFMEAVQTNSDYTLSFTREETGEVITKTVNAKSVFDKLAEMNWDMAEPGMLFWDNITSWNLMSNNDEFEYSGVNPCAEEPLPSGGSCLLGSINLSEFVLYPYTNRSKFNFDQFVSTVKIAVKALNDVLDEGLPLHPLQIQRDNVKDWRQIGLGVFGIADMLIKLGIKYGSKDSIMLCKHISKLLAQTAIKESCELAIENGAFPKCNNEQILSNAFFNNLFNEDDPIRIMISKYGLRNSQLLTIAPTGTLSTMLKCSGGIEPYFAKSWKRKTESLHGKEVYYTERPKAIQELMDVRGLKNDDELPDYVVTSADIDPVDRISMQAAWQCHIDASISSTLNLPNSATVDDVKKIYLAAWHSGLKGITIYRDGCRRGGVLTTDNSNSEKTCASSSLTDFPRGYIVDASDDLVGYKKKLNTGCGSIHFEVYADELTGEPQETFINIGSSGGCERNYQFISRLMSLALRAGVPMEAIIDQAMSIRPCTAYINRTKTKGDTSPGTSCPSAIGCALKDISERYLLTSTAEYELEETEEEVVEESNAMLCPECGVPLLFENGCNICKNCGHSKCD